MIARTCGQPKARKLMAQLDKHSVKVYGAIYVRLVPGSTLRYTDRLWPRAFGRLAESTTNNREIKIPTTSQLYFGSTVVFCVRTLSAHPLLSRSLLLRCEACGPSNR